MFICRLDFKTGNLLNFRFRFLKDILARKDMKKKLVTKAAKILKSHIYLSLPIFVISIFNISILICILKFF